MSLLNSFPVGDAKTAALYIRMSTDHQKYSIENQTEALESYARQKQLCITARYIDKGKSGLTLSKRPSLIKLLDDVKRQTALFSNILVLDVSRWGRFQDVDEGAYYEFLCRSFGIAIHYAHEEFGTDKTPYASILKTFKRVMAAEYSRELSVRVVRGQRLLAAKGFHLGGTVPYGLRRILIGEDGQIKRQLKSRERKSVQGERIRLVPGPERERALINWIYDKFLEDDIGELEITSLLNRRGILASDRKPWTRDRVSKLLQNEKYIGNLIAFKVSGRLGAKGTRNTPETWVRADNVIPPVVSREKFDAVQQKIFERRQILRSRLTNEELLSVLKKHCLKSGRISYAILAKHPELPSVSTYQSRFGGMTQVYELIGYKPKYSSSNRVRKNRRYKKIARTCAKTYANLLRNNKKCFRWLSTHPYPAIETPLRRVSFAVSSSYPSLYRGGPTFSRCSIGARVKISDLIVILQLDDANSSIKYYYVVKSREIHRSKIVINKTLKVHRLNSLAEVHKEISNLSKDMSAISVSRQTCPTIA